MRIEPNKKPVELSYIDLLDGLRKDLESDVLYGTMPVNIKEVAMSHVEALQQLLEAYSA